MKSHFSKIPSVNLLLEQLSGYTDRIDINYIKRITEGAIAQIKLNPGKYNLDIKSREEITKELYQRVSQEINGLISPTLKKIINATGVILHTGLGRAPLGHKGAEALQYLSDYTNLEVNLKTGKRGQRLDHIAPLIRLLTGAEDAVVVNNNAAAVLLALNSIARRREVIISRGELVEIGGSFRMPEVMTGSGTKMIEIGATNKTHLNDYADAITPKTGAIMLVHPSNFEIVGFTAKPGLAEIVKLAHQHAIPVIYDLGSGALLDVRRYGLEYEPVVTEMVALDIDIITFSGDKLLGGPQAGIIAGKNSYLQKIKKNHLLRALRCDKLTLSLLSNVLRSFLHQDSLPDKNYTMGLFARTEQDIKKTGKYIISLLTEESLENIKLVKKPGRVGSGALPNYNLPSFALKIIPHNISASRLARRMRANDPPVMGHIENDEFYLNLLAIKHADAELIAAAINSLS